MLKNIFLLILLFGVTNLYAADIKIGFVNVPKVLEKAPQAAKAKKQLEKEFSPRDKQLVSQQKAIVKLEENLSRDAAVLSESERLKLEREILGKKRESKRSQQEFSEDFNIRRNEELGKLQERIMDAIKEIAKEEKFDLLLTDGVIYASSKIDVTEKVQAKLATLAN